MKKRSLFAAVAMLIVSAMVLTSATYAWFNVGGGSNVIKNQGTVMQAGSGVRLKTDSGMDWNNVLLPQDFWNFSTNNPNKLVKHFRATLQSGSTTEYDLTEDASTASSATAFYQPMSSADGVNFFMYNIKGDNSFALSSDNANSGNFRDQYEFWVGTLIDETAGTTVNATFKLYGPSSNTAAAAARAVVFISTDGGTNWVPYNGTNFEAGGYDSSVDTIVYSAGAETAATNAVVAAVNEGDYKITDISSGSGVKRYIMDDTDTNFSATANDNKFAAVTPVNASGGVTIQLKGVHDTSSSQLKIRTVIWIEGQDSDCIPTLGGKSIFSEWGFTIPQGSGN